MQTIGRLIANPAPSQPALSSPQTAEVLLRQLNDYQPSAPRPCTTAMG